MNNAAIMGNWLLFVDLIHVEVVVQSVSNAAILDKIEWLR